MGTYSSPGVDTPISVKHVMSEPYFPDEQRMRTAGIFFAGEACALRHWSVMHGARKSGLDAAVAIGELMMKA